MGKIWTSDELAFIAEHDSWTARQLAAHLGRTLNAVAVRRNRERRGVIRAQGNGPADWTMDEDEFLLTTVNLTAWQAAKRLTEMGRNRTAGGVKSRRQQLTKLTGVAFGDYQTRNKHPLHIHGPRLVAKTCTTCGLLLGPEWYSDYRPGRGYNGRCRKCSSELSASRGWRKDEPGQTDAGKESKRYWQNESLLTADRAGMEWTEVDHRVAADPDLTIIEKAKRLRRTYFAVHNMTQRNGYPSRHPLPRIGEPVESWVIG